MSYRSLLNLTCSVERATVTTDDRGRDAIEWATVISGLPCALVLVSARDEQREHGLALDADLKLLVEPSADIRPLPSAADPGAQPDRVVIGGVKYLVRSVSDPTGRGRCKVAFLRRQV
jgi:hypothetical protein